MIKPGKLLLGFMALVVLASYPALAAEPAAAKAEGAKAKPAAHAMAKPVVWPADQLKWVDTPGANGVKMAVLWGDPTKGPHGAIHKFPAGFKVPLHTHTADLHGVVLSGTIIHGEADGTETRLGPGSYLFDPHTEKHTTACDAASECQMFVQASGKFDVKMVEEKSMEKKAAK
jgi:Domain of unknown function (DUF4437)